MFVCGRKGGAGRGTLTTTTTTTTPTPTLTTTVNPTAATNIVKSYCYYGFFHTTTTTTNNNNNNNNNNNDNNNNHHRHHHSRGHVRRCIGRTAAPTLTVHAPACTVVARAGVKCPPNIQVSQSTGDLLYR